MGREQTFFDFAAAVGLTKHLGGVEATDELAALCGIRAGSYVLDVGCGAGVTPCYLVSKYGCTVVGVDIVEGMVERSRERAAKQGVAGKVTFKVADAQALPFEDNLFDAVITESVTAFPEDKAKAVREYARVTKPGGYVGLNESTWLKAPPPPEMVAWSEQEIGANVKPLTPDEWKGLLEAAGLGEIVVRLRPIQTSDEARGLVERYGRGGMLGVFWRMLRLYVSSPAYRQFVKRVGQGGIIPEHLDDYFGYGIYVGRK